MKILENEAYFNKLNVIFEENKNKYIDILNKDANYGIRLNSLKSIDNTILTKLSLKENKVPWANFGYYIYLSNENPDNKISKNPLYEAGAYYIQEPSAMIPATVLDICEGDIVLDMCAAPGGKTTLLGEKLNGTGALVANDISNSRAKILAKNVEKFGITNAIILSEKQEVLSKKFTNFFDKILIDAPCSGEGMFRKEPDVIKYWHDKIDLEYSDIQKDLLNVAGNLLKNGGEIVYSTCTFNKIENENIILWFLENNPNFELITLNHSDLGIEKGYNISKDYDLTKTGRIFPFSQRGEGHFVAKLRKKGNLVKSELGNNHKTFSNKKYNMLMDFVDNNFNLDLKTLGNYLVKHRESYFLSPLNPELFKGVRVVRSGFHLGDENKKFLPSSVFARGIESNQFKVVVNFDSTDINVLKYLKGETIDYDLDYSGYVLISVDNLPLGFGIIKNNKIKNKYNKYWIVN